MGSYYQPASYLKGGKRKSRKIRKHYKGGFYPSVMGGIAKSSQYLLPVAFRAGSQLLESHFKKRKTKTTRKNRK